MKPVLYVGNRNYSSWSLRPYLVLSWAKIEFETRVVKLGGPGYLERAVAEVLEVSSTGTVPVLHLGEDRIPDSLAIAEWAAEQARGLWPNDPMARAHARAAVCEMHSSFAALRAKMPCNVRRRAEPRRLESEVRRDVTRIELLWSELRARFGAGGPYLFGAKPTIADAFYTPVATRFRTYAVPLSPASQAYADALLAEPSFLAWEADAIAEPWTIPATDAA
jgi:glutathione S-transferase